MTYTTPKDNTTRQYYQYPSLNVNAVPDPDDTTTRACFEINTITGTYSYSISSYAWASSKMQQSSLQIF